MPRYKLTIEYDGTPYRGWQRQQGLQTIQQSIEEAFQQFCQHPVTLFAAGRTDAGVHATGQVAHVDLQKEWRPAKIQEAANSLLKLADHPVALTQVDAVDEEFDARFSAVQRHYRYRIINRMAPLTVERDRAWWVRHPLDVAAMHEAAQVLVGKHDFTTFRSTDCQAKSPIRTVDEIIVQEVMHTHLSTDGREIEILISSRSFLHNQVRSIAGTLKLVGDGKWSRKDVKDALDARDRKACGPVAPACGLYLTRVDY